MDRKSLMLGLALAGLAGSLVPPPQHKFVVVKKKRKGNKLASRLRRGKALWRH